MKHSILFLSLLAAGLITLLFSCTETIDIKLDNSYSRLTVFGEITTDTSVHSIAITRSADYFYNRPAEPVSGALVKITEGETETIFTENDLKPGIYESPGDFYGIPGRNYHMLVTQIDLDNDGILESYSAQSYLPEMASPDSISLNYVKYSFFEGSEILLYARDPAETVDYYAFKIERNGVLQTDSLSEIIIQDDLLFNGNYTNGVQVQYLDNSKPGEKVMQGDTITFLMYGINKEYYNFIMEAKTELFGSNPLFSGPPANIPTNISNGAIGFFAAVNLKRSTVIAPPK